MYCSVLGRGAESNAMLRPIYIVGTGLSHDGSACLLADGVVRFAIEKERLSRIKHDGGNDRLAVEYVLDAAGITLDDVALIVQNENFGMFRGGNASYRSEPRALSDSVEVVTISHHLAHAYSAFAASPFSEAAVLVLDGCGNAYEDCIDLVDGTALEPVPAGLGHAFFEKDSCYAAAGNGIRTVAKDFSPWGPMGWPIRMPSTLHSLGGAYRTFSEYVFGGFDDSGKLMGLAPYGRPGRFDMPLFDLVGGRTFVCRDSLDGFTTPATSRADMRNRFDYFADVARWVQDEIERALLYLIRDRLARVPSGNLAYAGGVALNAVANSRVLRECGLQRLFVQPAAGDNGLALGCAYYGWLQVLGRDRVRPTGSTSFGRSYPLPTARDRTPTDPTRVLASGPAEVIQRAAELLADGKVVGWYEGGAEFGPRALGHRSILAHPSLPGLRDHINQRIKFREDFRPFAPSVLAEQASRYFDCAGYDSPYMILVFDVLPEWRDRLCNVVHEDGSARLHTVAQPENPRYHELICRFQELTGLPILLNTSLNKRGMPIVETPAQALALFLEGELDALVLNDVLLGKVTQPDGVRRIRGRTAPPQVDDVPLLGARIEGVSLLHDVSHRPDSGISADRGVVVLRFADSPEPLELAPDAYRLLRLVDGVRGYGQIAALLHADVDYVLEFATALAEIGILDHLEPAVLVKVPVPSGAVPRGDSAGQEVGDG
jgi:carbamoyltransferase